MKSFIVRFLPVLKTFSIAAALVLLTGCADALNYSNDSKKEGIREYNDGKYADATGSFRNAFRQNPTDSETEYWLGLSYEQTGDFHEAIVAYKTALLMNANRADALYSQRVHDQSLDRLAHVIADTDTTHTETDLLARTAAEGKSPEQYQLLARIARYRGDADTALDSYQQSLKLDPNNFAVQKEFGLYLEQLGQNQLAGETLRNAYRLNTTDKEVNDGLRQIGMEPGPSLLAGNHADFPAPPAGSLPAAVPAANTTPPSAPMPAPRD